MQMDNQASQYDGYLIFVVPDINILYFSEE